MVKSWLVVEGKTWQENSIADGAASKQRCSMNFSVRQLDTIRRLFHVSGDQTLVHRCCLVGKHFTVRGTGKFVKIRGNALPETLTRKEGSKRVRRCFVRSEKLVSQRQNRIIRAICRKRLDP